MIGRTLPWVLALAAFLVVGFFVADNQVRTSFAIAEGTRDACYFSKGYPREAYTQPPPAVIAECTRPIVEHDQDIGPYLVGGGAGLVAALLVLGLVLGWRRATSGRAAEPS